MHSALFPPAAINERLQKVSNEMAIDWTPFGFICGFEFGSKSTMIDFGFQLCKSCKKRVSCNWQQARGEIQYICSRPINRVLENVQIETELNNWP